MFCPFCSLILCGFLAARIHMPGGDSPVRAGVGVLLSALPSGANCFIVARQYGRYVRRASSAILISTLVAAFTVSVVLNLPVMSSP